MEAHMVAQLQKQGNGVLGHCICAVGRNVGNNDPCISGCAYVHNIIACGQYPDKPQVGAALYCPGAYGRLICIHRLCLANAFHHPVLGRPVINRQIPQVLQALPAQIPRIFRISV